MNTYEESVLKRQKSQSRSKVTLVRWASVLKNETFRSTAAALYIIDYRIEVERKKSTTRRQYVQKRVCSTIVQSSIAWRSSLPLFPPSTKKKKDTFCSLFIFPFLSSFLPTLFELNNDVHIKVTQKIIHVCHFLLSWSNF